MSSRRARGEHLHTVGDVGGSLRGHNRDGPIPAGRYRGGCGGCLAGEEGAKFGDGGHDWGREHDGGVLIHSDLDQALQIT